MKTTLPRRIGALSAVLAFAATALSATPAAAGAPTTTVFKLDGTYLAIGSTLPIISRNGDALTVDMSSLGRPAAHGSVIDSDSITVTFPDDATYDGTLVEPGTIRWSNQTLWHKTKPTPKVTGLTAGRAVTTLSRTGFTRGTVTTVVIKSCYHVGVVVTQVPSAGTPAVPGSPVDLTIGTPPPNRCH